MRGVESAAMVLCASLDGTVELVEPPVSSVVGDQCFFEGYEGIADVQLKSKEKVWELEQPRFLTSGTKEAGYLLEGKFSALKTKTGICTVPTIVNGCMK